MQFAEFCEKFTWIFTTPHLLNFAVQCTTTCMRQQFHLLSSRHFQFTTAVSWSIGPVRTRQKARNNTKLALFMSSIANAYAWDDELKDGNNSSEKTHLGHAPFSWDSELTQCLLWQQQQRHADAAPTKPRPCNVSRPAEACSCHWEKIPKSCTVSFIGWWPVAVY